MAKKTIKGELIKWWAKRGTVSFSEAVDKYIELAIEIRGTAPREREHVSSSMCKILRENGDKLGAKGSKALWQYGGALKQTVTVKKMKEAKAASAKKSKTYVAFVIDKSSSMNYIWREAKAAFNQNITDVKKSAADMNEKTEVMIVSFSYHDCVYVDQSPIDVKSVLDFDDYNIVPTGMTALFDGVGHAIQNLEALDDGHIGTSFLVVVVTDGMENNSKKFGASRLKKLISKCHATDRWTFAFSMPVGGDTYVLDKLGLYSGNVQTWDQTSEGVRRMSSTTSRGIGTTYTNKSIGINSTKDFYSVDMTSVSTSDLKKLRNVAKFATSIEVKKEVDIRDLVESKGHTYVKGAAFYQLTKKEKRVQPNKEVAIMKKKGRAIYIGDEARSLIGLPPKGGHSKNIVVEPGNMADYDVFIQSRSVNRKCVRGTKLLYFPGGLPV